MINGQEYITVDANDSQEAKARMTRRRADAADRAAAAALAANASDSEDESQYDYDFAAEGQQRRMSMTDAVRRKRAQLNEQLAQEMKMKEGCENMIAAMTAKKPSRRRRSSLKAELADLHVNLSFTNARIQALQSELHRLNGSLHSTVRKCMLPEQVLEESLRGLDLTHKSTVGRLVQRVGDDHVVPLIALGTKQCDPLDLKGSLESMLASHYHEPAARFKSELETMQALRESMATALSVDEHTRDQCFLYFHYLTQCEHRFFVDGKNPEVVFAWFDSFCGQPTVQRNIALEKACILFNAAALSSQLATAQERNTPAGLCTAIDHLELAAGLFRYINIHFTNAPTTDLSSVSLGMLHQLMLAQAQECQWRLYVIRGKNESVDWHPSGREAAAVADMYAKLGAQMAHPTLAGVIPSEWVNLCKFKELYFDGLADHYVAQKGCQTSDRTTVLESIARWQRASTLLKCASKMCREMMADEVTLQSMVDAQLETVRQALATENQDDVMDQKEASKALGRLAAATETWATATEHPLPAPPPDLFAKLGPLYFFNALCPIAERREHTIAVGENVTELGMELAGDGPASIFNLHPAGPAKESGLRDNDFIVAVNGDDMRHCGCEATAEALAYAAGEGTVKVTVVVNPSRQNLEATEAAAAALSSEQAGGQQQKMSERRDSITQNPGVAWRSAYGSKSGSNEAAAEGERRRSSRHFRRNSKQRGGRRRSSHSSMANEPIAEEIDRVNPLFKANI